MKEEKKMEKENRKKRRKSNPWKVNSRQKKK